MLGEFSGVKEEAGGSKLLKKEHQVMLDRLYVCPSCFKYSRELVAWWGHVRACDRLGNVPGRRIYVHPKGRRRVFVPQGNKGMTPKRRKGEGGVKYVEEMVQDEGEWSIWEVDGEVDGVSHLYFVPSYIANKASYSAKIYLSSQNSSSTTNLSSST